MQLALMTTFSPNKKEPLAELLHRIHAAFAAAGEGEPHIRFALSDTPLPNSVSSVDRVLKRHPNLDRFLSTSAAVPGIAPVRHISNAAGTPAAGEPVDFAILHQIAAGIPRSFPFHNAQFAFHSSAFGEARAIGGPGTMAPGIIVGDSWWVSGRTRSLMALTLVDAQPNTKKLPPPPEPVAIVLAACGKAKKTVQLPIAAPAAAQNPAAAEAVRAIIRDYRARLAEILDRATLPHDFPPMVDALKQTPIGTTSGPRKPALVAAFKPKGYDCKGESGVFTLSRRTPANLTVEITLDVGTWSNMLTGHYHIHGLGFTALLPLSVSKQNIGTPQYPIGDAARWQQLVDNLAALVTELDQTFLPEIESAAGPSPAWYTPHS